MSLRIVSVLVIYFFLCSSALAQNIFFSGNDDNSIFLCEDGRVFMSGENNVGQLGRGSFVPSNVPVQVSGIGGMGSLPRCKQVQIEGVATFLALSNSGDSVFAWGPNQAGQVGDGTTEQKLSPVLVRGPNGEGFLNNVVQITTGNQTGYALTESGMVLGWGLNSFGQIGNGNTISPVLFPDYVLKAPGDTLKNVRMISAGGVYALALLCDGTVWGWGRNNLGQLAQNNTTNLSYATRLKKTDTQLLDNIIKIEAGDNYAFALSASDTLWCWGPNWDGRLGTGNTTDYLLPGFVKDPTGLKALKGVKEVAAGQGHGVVLTEDGTVYTWGINHFGQLGCNDTLPKNLPVQVKDPSGTGFLSGINYVASGDEFCIARSNDNKIYVWGANYLGQLGLNDHVHRWLPVILNLPCVPAKDTFPGIGKIEFPSSACVGDNTGLIQLTKYHASIAGWEISENNFISSIGENSKENLIAFSNLNSTTSFRAVLSTCGVNYYSDVATIKIDALTVPGVVHTSAAVRKNNNRDTLHLLDHLGKVVRWEYSNDNFEKDVKEVYLTDPHFIYSNLTSTTQFRALVKQGTCPAAYAHPAEISTIEEDQVKVYNAFSPDGDNINDVWIIDHIDLFPQNNIQIFNRWGQLVFKAGKYDNSNVVWKGENNQHGNKPLEDGTYFYHISLGEGFQEIKGYVVIGR